MNPSLSDPYVELRVLNAKTEREFLQLAVQAAARKYRQLRTQARTPRAADVERSAPSQNVG